MPRIYFEITDAEKKELEGKASSFGLPLSTYVRNLFFDRFKSFKKLSDEPQESNLEVIKSIRALVPTLAEAIGRFEKAPPEILEKFAGSLLKKWEKERGKS